VTKQILNLSVSGQIWVHKTNLIPKAQHFAK